MWGNNEFGSNNYGNGFFSIIKKVWRIVLQDISSWIKKGTD